MHQGALAAAGAAENADGLAGSDGEIHMVEDFAAIGIREGYIFKFHAALDGTSATQEERFDAARTACVHDVIESFSEGYDTMVGERGVTLSGGQKQRVAIARMLVQKTPICIFDDSLSAVDAETPSMHTWPSVGA